MQCGEMVSAKRVRRACLKCGKTMLTTKFRRICSACHKANELLHYNVCHVQWSELEADAL